MSQGAGNFSNKEYFARPVLLKQDSVYQIIKQSWNVTILLSSQPSKVCAESQTFSPNRHAALLIYLGGRHTNEEIILHLPFSFITINIF